MVQPSRAYSSKDMPAHTKLKERAIGQGSRFEAGQIDFKAELLQREKALQEAKGIPTDYEPQMIQNQAEETLLGKRKHELEEESD
jgi:protein CWC15